MKIEKVNELIEIECNKISQELIQKTADYNNSLYQPNIFNQNPIEGIKARISDKINRIAAKGIDDKTEDSIGDLIGYLIHLKIMLKNG